MKHRSQAQIFVAFVLAHIVLSAIAGFAVWQLIDAQIRQNAENSARSVARILAEGGFTVNEQVLERMQTLTGYRFILFPATQPFDKLLVQVPLSDGSGRLVAIDYRSQGYHEHVQLVFTTTLSFLTGGVIIFIPVAWMLARRFSRPLEQLAENARQIGAGNWDSPIQAGGTLEIENVSQALENMRLQLKRLDHENRQAERLATLGTFTATIAHEVRNPLSAIKLMVQMLEQEHDDERLRYIQGELERLDLIVDELLGYSAGMAVETQVCALEDVVRDVLRLLQRQADHAGVSMHQQGSAQVLADPRRLRQLLMNLVLNAIQVQHGEGSLTVEIAADGFTVLDQGPGVPEDLIPDLFSPFHSRRKQGTGLGLHLAVRIAEAHDAQLVHEHSERGTCFSLRGLKPA
jgi:signal transduction histidine kinase